MTANATVVNTNEFFCVPVGKSRQAAIFLGNLVKNAIEEGKRIPKRMEMGSDLGTCIKWIEDIGVPVIYAYSAYYSAKCRGMMKGEGQSMRVALEFISTIFGQLSADECMLGGRGEFCSKGKKIVAALNQLCGEASLLAKNPELLNVTKYCVEGADMLRCIADIWDLAPGVAENNEERSFTAAFHPHNSAKAKQIKNGRWLEPNACLRARHMMSTRSLACVARSRRALAYAEKLAHKKLQSSPAQSKLCRAACKLQPPQSTCAKQLANLHECTCASKTRSSTLRSHSQEKTVMSFEKSWKPLLTWI